MAKRLVIILGAIVFGFIAYTQFVPKMGDVTISDARAMPIGASGKMFMVTLTIANAGKGVALAGVESPTGAAVSVMPSNRSTTLVIPGNGQGLFAMDGAHLMLAIPEDDTFEKGTFQPIALSFEDGSTASARVLYPDNLAGVMDHNTAQGVVENPAPKIAFASLPSATAEGFGVNIMLEDFKFVLADDDADHVPNEGHAHVYLNGLKLGRLYDTRFEVGSLPAGEYDLLITLNSNDHRPYLQNGAPVALRFAFEIEE